jgi:hypothetical protein
LAGFHLPQWDAHLLFDGARVVHVAGDAEELGSETERERERKRKRKRRERRERRLERKDHATYYAWLFVVSFFFHPY